MAPGAPARAGRNTVADGVGFSVTPHPVDELLITGASGLLGTVLRRGLEGRYSIRGLDRRPGGERGIRKGDIRRPRPLARALEGADAVVHLAAVAQADAGWEEVLEHNVRGTTRVLEAAREAGVSRFVYASSNHVTGMYEHERPYSSIVAGKYDGLEPDRIPLIGADMPVRPDGPYAVSKVFGEAAVRHHCERFGLRAVCLRIGTVNAGDRPERPRHFATLLSHADLVRLVDCAIAASNEIDFAVVYGVSANRWRFWEIADAAGILGFVPQDDAERFRESTTSG